jgi:NADPH2:quinone reductase
MTMAAEIPARMKAAAIDEFGPLDNVHVELVPVPRLGTHQVLVEVATAGIGSWDPDLVEGTFKVGKVHLPQVFGADGAGTIRAVGAHVTRFAIGDRVYGWGFGNSKGGFFAEYAAIDDTKVAKIPRTIGFHAAGALAMDGITALLGLEHLELAAGDSVMIFGASGGVGHLAVQLAKRLDLKVFAVASRPDGVALARQLGADVVVDGHRGFQKAARELAPDGFAGALVIAGGDGWKDALELVARGGRVAWPNGVEPEPEVARGTKRLPYDATVSKQIFDRLNELVARGPFQVHVAKYYSLDKTSQALKDVQRHHLGKLAIRVHA